MLNFNFDRRDIKANIMSRLVRSSSFRVLVYKEQNIVYTFLISVKITYFFMLIDSYNMYIHIIYNILFVYYIIIFILFFAV